jgi:hypothetical protein
LKKVADAVYGSSSRSKDNDFLRKANKDANRSGNDDQSDDYADELFDYEERIEIKGFK